MFFGTNTSNGAFSVSSGQGLSMEVILGGGGAYFHAPKSLDSKDYYGVAAGQGYNVALNKTAMYAAAAAGSSKLLGIFHESNMDKWREWRTYHPGTVVGHRSSCFRKHQIEWGDGTANCREESFLCCRCCTPSCSGSTSSAHVAPSCSCVPVDRNVYPQNIASAKDYPDGSGRAATDQPGLVDMLNVSLSILSKNPNGFYLMVEAASVDKMAHALDWVRHRRLAPLRCVGRSRW